VTERGLDKLLLGLGAQLEAAEKRAEEEAANDLALSLTQDSLMADSLTRGRAVTILIDGGGRLAAAAVGSDFIWIDGPRPQIRPLAQAVVRLEDRGRPPTRWHMSLLEACRQMARSGATVEVTWFSGSGTGILERGARDFLSVKTAQGPVVVPYSAIQCISLIRGGLTGDS
jgi:hypothetical protein